MQRIAALIAALWAGSLVTICALVAPTLFAVLEDRSMAGRLAGRFFRLETWISVAFAAALIALLYPTVAHRGRATNLVLVAIAAAGPLASTLVLGRFMEQARLAGAMARFGLLHGVSAILFGIACLSALALLWRLIRK